LLLKKRWWEMFHWLLAQHKRWWKRFSNYSVRRSDDMKKVLVTTWLGKEVYSRSCPFPEPFAAPSRISTDQQVPISQWKQHEERTHDMCTIPARHWRRRAFLEYINIQLQVHQGQTIPDSEIMSTISLTHVAWCRKGIHNFRDLYCPLDSSCSSALQ
jgi:hypothetical protein